MAELIDKSSLVGARCGIDKQPGPERPPIVLTDAEERATEEFRLAARELKAALEAVNSAQRRFKAAESALCTAMAGDFTPQG